MSFNEYEISYLVAYLKLHTDEYKKHCKDPYVWFASCAYAIKILLNDFEDEDEIFKDQNVRRAYTEPINFYQENKELFRLSTEEYIRPDAINGIHWDLFKALNKNIGDEDLTEMLNQIKEKSGNITTPEPSKEPPPQPVPSEVPVFPATSFHPPINPVPSFLMSLPLSHTGSMLVPQLSGGFLQPLPSNNSMDIQSMLSKEGDCNMFEPLGYLPSSYNIRPLYSSNKEEPNESNYDSNNNHPKY